MPKVLTSTEAQTKFGSVLKWMADNEDEVVIELYNRPAAVLMSYAEYEKVIQLREEARRREAWEAIQAVRQRVRARNQDLSQEEAYRLAGFSEEVIRETIAAEEARVPEAQAAG